MAEQKKNESDARIEDMYQRMKDMESRYNSQEESGVERSKETESACESEKGRRPHPVKKIGAWFALGILAVAVVLYLGYNKPGSGAGAFWTIFHKESSSETDLSSAYHHSLTGSGKATIEDRGDIQFEAAVVERVVDGDTLTVNIEGSSHKVRMIGINSPESVHPDPSRNTTAGIKASEYTKQLLPSGTKVYLQSDVSDTDQYDRLLRYVWLQMPEYYNDSDMISKYMVNAILVREGYAKARKYRPDTMYSEYFVTLKE